MKCLRETEILVEQQPPQGVFVCDHAGLVINKFSLNQVHSEAPPEEPGLGFREWDVSDWDWGFLAHEKQRAESSMRSALENPAPGSFRSSPRGGRTMGEARSTPPRGQVLSPFDLLLLLYYSRA